MRYKKWEIGGFERDAAVSLCRNGINPLVSVLLTSRGITGIDEVRERIGESADAIPDPFLMTDMDRAAARINAAVESGERIAIYGDYDVDGMTACALLAQWLKSRGAEFEVYIPNRLDEGYGLNTAALDCLKERGASLVVTVDCGITAIDEAEHAREIGLSLVITDHHECRDKIPDADAVVNPKRPDCGYPHKNLAGVGVAFKLVSALENGAGINELIGKYGDLTAVGTVADVMPAIGENRELIRRGLRVINGNPRPGLSRLLREAYPERRAATTATLGFVVAPRLNAACRMGQTDVSIKLLMTDDAAEAETLTQELIRLNLERRRLETLVYDEAAGLLPEEPTAPIVLARRGWFQGVTGIVAARLAERCLLPAIIISIDENGIGRGSCRSFGSFGLYNALQACSDILLSYGGHEMAAGLTLREDDIEELNRRITEYYRAAAKSLPPPGLLIDFEVKKPELLAIANIEALGQLEPFGNCNPPPVLCVRGARLSGVQSIGEGKHSRFKIEKCGTYLDCIYFSMPSEELDVSDGDSVDVAFEPQINEFRGRVSVQLRVIDIRPGQS